MMEREGVLSVHQGKEVELLCRASGDDPIAITWRKGGRDLIAQPGTKTTLSLSRSVKGGGVLQHRQVQR
jgi:Immunoglobulin domain